MNLEVGMYIRYVPTTGQYEEKISKITKMENSLLDMAYYLDNEIEQPVYSSYFDEIIKASYNLIDLIEVGDYVNGYRIVKIFVNKYNGKKLLIALYQEEDYEYSDNFEDYMCDDSIHIYEEDIKTILTKEQFENNCYKVIEK